MCVSGAGVTEVAQLLPALELLTIVTGKNLKPTGRLPNATDSGEHDKQPCAGPHGALNLLH